MKLRRKMLLPLLFISSTLVWFCLLRLPRRSSPKNTSTVPSTGSETSINSKTYENTSFSPVRVDALDIQDSPNSFDAFESTFTDHHSPALEIEGSVTVAIIPIGRGSLASLSATLAIFLPLSSAIQEIALLCPSAEATAARDVLREVFMDEDDTHFDVSIITWPIGLEEGSAVLYAARQVAGDRLILFDSSSLSGITYETLAMLSSPLATPLPVGPRGYNISEDNVSCIEADEDPKAAAFLVPPFSVAPTLVPPHDLVPATVYDVWQALGEHISRARFEHVGGVAVSWDLSASAWCPGRTCETSTVLGPVLAVGTSDHCPATDTALPDHNICHDTAPSLVVAFGSETSFHRFSAAICRMKSQGHTLTFLLLAHTNATQEPISLAVPLSLCTIEVTSFPRYSDLLAAQIQISIASCPPAAIVLSGLEPAVSDAVRRAVSENHASTTLVQIPDQDLPYCDWLSLLSIDAWHNWAKPQLEISVITDDRPTSLGRLLASLSAAYFFGDSVTLRINIEQTAGPQTLQLINEFHWPHGPVFLHRRIIHGGLLPAVVESWYPQSNDSYGLILEDDVELSPLFYAWVKMSLLHYRYDQPRANAAALFGISLYQQKILELRPEGRHRFDARTVFASAAQAHVGTPYLSQIPCSWGAVYFPEQWREFHDYLAARLSGHLLPVGGIVAPGLRSNKWTRSWKKYFIELVFLRGYVMLYPNYRDYLSLSTNHLEVGSHVKETTPEAYELKKKLYQLPLLRPTPIPGFGSDDVVPRVETGLLDLPAERMPEWDALPVLDLLGLLTTAGELHDRGAARSQELFRCSNVADASGFVRSPACPRTPVVLTPQ